jgi:formate dehydrogenase subunit delta
MHIESLLKMANQIGAFFEAMPDRPEALQGIANHFKKFWEPRMRRELLMHIDATAANNTDSGLSAVVSQAISQHRALLSEHALPN